MAADTAARGWQGTVAGTAAWVAERGARAVTRAVVRQLGDRERPPHVPSQTDRVSLSHSSASGPTTGLGPKHHFCLVGYGISPTLAPPFFLLRACFWRSTGGGGSKGVSTKSFFWWPWTLSA